MSSTTMSSMAILTNMTTRHQLASPPTQRGHPRKCCRETSRRTARQLQSKDKVPRINNSYQSRINLSTMSQTCRTKPKAVQRARERKMQLNNWEIKFKTRGKPRILGYQVVNISSWITIPTTQADTSNLFKATLMINIILRKWLSTLYDRTQASSKGCCSGDLEGACPPIRLARSTTRFRWMWIEANSKRLQGPT